MDWLILLKEFQTLATGVLAIGAALITATAIWSSARLPIREERRKQKAFDQRHERHVKTLLFGELDLIVANCTKLQTDIHGIVTTFNTNYNLYQPPVFEEWEHMSILDTELFTRLHVLRTLIIDYNLSVNQTPALDHIKKGQLAQDLGDIKKFASRMKKELASELNLLNEPKSEKSKNK